MATSGAMSDSEWQQIIFVELIPEVQFVSQKCKILYSKFTRKR